MESVIAWASGTTIGQDITVCQGDVRAIQLAKEAIYAGAKLMMYHLGVHRLGKVALVRAFGNYIAKKSAKLNWDFLAEYALSILVEVEGLKILFDTDFGTSATHNARILGIALSSADKSTLSHGHNDHTGELQEVLREIGKVEPIAHPDICDTKYACIGEKNAL